MKYQQRIIAKQVMFLCCCPSKRQSHQESLLSQVPQNSNNQEQKVLTNSKLKVLDQTYLSQMNFKNFGSQLNKKPLDESKKRPIQHQQKKQSNQLSKINKKNRSQRNMSKNIAQSQKIQTNRKFKLWKQQEKSDIIFYNTSKKSPCLVSFFLKRKYNTNLDSLEHILKKSKDKSNAIISRDLIFQSTNLCEHFTSINNVYIHMQQTQTQYKNLQIIKSKKFSAIRLSIFDQIIILNSKMEQYSDIKKTCLRVTQNLGFEELKNVIYIFPGYLRLQQIANIIFKSFKKFIDGEPIQKIISDLTFDVELIDNGHLGLTFIVRNREKQTKQQKRNIDQRKLTIPLLQTDHTDATQKLHKACYRSIKEKKINQFLLKVNELKINPDKKKDFIDENSDANVIFEKNKIQQVYLENGKGCYCIISKKTKQNINHHNHQYIRKNQRTLRQDSDTPVKVDQWDDELLNKFRAPQKSDYSDSQGRSCLQKFSDDDIDELNIELELENMQQIDEQEDINQNNFEMEVNEKET